MAADGRPVIALPSRPSDVALPPYARRLDVRATRAAFAAGTLTPVGDNVTGENMERDVEVRHFDGYNADDVKHAERLRLARLNAGYVALTDHRPREWYDEAESVRQGRLRRWQTIR